MRPALLAALLLFAGACVAPLTVHAAPPASAAIAAVAPRCAASVEEAARGILGSTGMQASEGYRVQDLVVDPVLRRAWVRVADCHDSRKPLTLVPLTASLASGVASATIPQTSSSGAVDASPAATSFHVPPAAPMLIARGDAVEVLVQSSNVHMTLEGHAFTAAPAGGEVDVVLDDSPTPGEPYAPPRHMHGIAAGAHRVEVQR